MPDHVNETALIIWWLVSSVVILVSMFFWFRSSRLGTDEYWAAEFCMLIALVASLWIGFWPAAWISLIIMVLLAIHSRL